MSQTATMPIPTRAAGAALCALAAGAFVLLSIHPGGGGKTFVEMLQAEAAGQAIDASVHGGFIVLLVGELACLSILSARLSRPAAVAALVFFGAGAAALAGSLLADGLIIPAIAAKYVALPQEAGAAKPVFTALGAAIRVLMPLGIGFQAMAVTLWGAALAGNPRYRFTGGAGILIGSALLIALAATTGRLDMLVVIGGIGGISAWLIAVGAAMARGIDRPA